MTDKMTRRDMIGLTGAGIGATLLGGAGTSAWAAEGPALPRPTPAVADDDPLFSNSQFAFYSDRLESFDVYKGVYRSSDGKTITQDGAPDAIWKGSRPDKLHLRTPFPILDAAFALAVDEALGCVAPAGTASEFLGGGEPGSPYYHRYYYWTHGRNIREYTRDTAQHVEWGDSVVIDRDTAAGTMLRRCDFESKRIREDLVVTADNIHFIPAALQYYAITGDQAFLEQTWDCMWGEMSVKENARKKEDGLWVGSPWTDNVSGFLSAEHFVNRNTQVKSLYANCLVAGAWRALGMIAGVLDKPAEQHLAEGKHRESVAAVNRELYLPEHKTYCYYKYGDRPVDNHCEDISAGMMYLYGVADRQRTLAYHDRFAATPYGYRNLDPVTSAGETSYHGGNVWENQEAYHGWMLAKLDRPDDLENFIFWHARAGLVIREWREGTINPTTGQLHENYKRLVWGAMGYTSYWTRGVFGINYDLDGLRFDPCVPSSFGADFHAELVNFAYRDASLKIILEGTGTTVERILVNGREVTHVPSDLKEENTVRIVMQRG